MPGYIMVVNRLGRRFYDESYPYGLTEVRMAAQPGAGAHIIIDDATKRAMRTENDILKYLKYLLPGAAHQVKDWTSAGMDALLAAGAIKRADTLEALAELIDVPPANLVGTVARYNKHVAAGEDADYLKKSDWLRPVSTPPYYVSPFTLCVMGVTGAGLRIDHDAAVIHETSRAIPGLYAAGECVGSVMGDVYVGSGNSLAACTVFGRIAGRSAAAYARKARARA
jgi:succinate dehydrogenase/fumarate reductase flavoprotein subunit